MDRNRSMPDELTEKTRDGDDSAGQDLLAGGAQDDEPADDAERAEGSDPEPSEATSP